MGDAVKGIPVHRYVNGEDPGESARFLDSSMFDVRMKWNGSDAEPGQWFPESQASRLVDTEDAGLRDVVLRAANALPPKAGSSLIADAVIAALKEHANAPR
jgi:hypothetical protein